jgi:hypothetical protein
MKSAAQPQSLQVFYGGKTGTGKRIDMEIAKTMVMKIQGLKIMYFFVKNQKNLSSIMNKMINGAKKISDTNGFFIKIY